MHVNYRVNFLAGPLKGKLFEFKNGTLTVGRSPNNDIVVTSGDISRQHLVIELVDGIPRLRYLSSHVGFYGNSKLEIGDMVPLSAEVPIKLGQETMFQMESYDDEASSDAESPTVRETTKSMSDLDPATVAPVSDRGSVPGDTGFRTTTAMTRNEAATEEPKTSPNGVTSRSTPQEGSDASSSPNDDDAGTLLNKTRLATPEEIQHAQNLERHHHILRYSLVALLLGTLFCALVAYYRIFIYDSPTAPINFPANAKKKVLTRWSLLAEKASDCRLFDYFYIIYPDIPRTDVKRIGGKLTVTSFVGRKWNIPYRVFFEYSNSMDNLHTDRKESFQEWMERKAEKEKWRFDTPNVRYFIGIGNGIPCGRVAYHRQDGAEYWFGMATYFRYEDYVITCLQELPEAEQWRGARFFDRNPALHVCDDEVVSASRDYWEGVRCSRRVVSDANVREAWSLLKRHSPNLWGHVEELLRTALPNIDRAKEQELYQRALEALRELRGQQRLWYNEQKIAYFRAQKEGNSDRMTDIQRECKAIFPNDEDWLFHHVRRKKWSL